MFREVIRLLGRMQALAIGWLDSDDAGLDADQLATIPPFGSLSSFRDQVTPCPAHPITCTQGGHRAPLGF